MRVLVTGHSGYSSSVLLPFLQSAGRTVTGLDGRRGFAPTPPARPNRRLVCDVEGGRGSEPKANLGT